MAKMLAHFSFLVVCYLVGPVVLTAGSPCLLWQPPLFRDEPQVDLGYTSYVGVKKGSVNVFLGMRYAAPPTGDLRWRAPVEPKKDSQTHSADEVRSSEYESMTLYNN